MPSSPAPRAAAAARRPRPPRPGTSDLPPPALEAPGEGKGDLARVARERAGVVALVSASSRRMPAASGPRARRGAPPSGERAGGAGKSAPETASPRSRSPKNDPAPAWSTCARAASAGARGTRRGTPSSTPRACARAAPARRGRRPGPRHGPGALVGQCPTVDAGPAGKGPSEGTTALGAIPMRRGTAAGIPALRSGPRAAPPPPAPRAPARATGGRRPGDVAHGHVLRVADGPDHGQPARDRARHSRSSSKATRSCTEPPPRATIATSTSGCCSSRASASMRSPGARRPCTTAQHDDMDGREALAQGLTTSAIPSEPRPAMTPTARGKAGRGLRRSTSHSPSARSRARSSARRRSSSPLPREPHLGDHQVEPAGAWEEVGPLDPHAHEVAGARAVLQPPQVLRPDLAR